MPDSLAERARAAARANPVVLTALRAGVCNVAAAARVLDVEGDPDAVATALRRFAGDLPDYELEGSTPRVTMERGVGLRDAADDAAGANDAAGRDGAVAHDPLFSIGGVDLVADAGDATALLATGAVDPPALAWTLSRLDAAEIGVTAAAVADGSLVVVVAGRDGPRALRTVERALEAVPTALADDA